METDIGARLIETLTSALYSEPIILFREYVQNSVDSFQLKKIKKEDFFISIDIYKDGRKLIITDNGFGISRNHFLNEMRSISNSKKNAQENQIGFKGIGRLSGLPFCKKLIFRNKPDDDNEIQVFIWNAEKYNELLNITPNKSLDDCISDITSENVLNLSDTENKKHQHFFSVELEDFSDELFNIIFTKDGNISENFITELSIMLPVPYADDFTYKEKIHKEYQKFFNQKCEDYEYKIIVNNDRQLFKPYKDDDIKNKDIHFLSYKFPEELSKKNSKLGILWFTFDYRFKAYRDDFGITVRSKNMLVNNRQVFADETSKSMESPTTYGQLVNGLKGIKGELLINTSLLTDNSKRDWFIYNKYGLFLRTIVVDFMAKLNIYRRTASKYFNSENQTEQQKENLIKVFNDFVSEPELSPLYQSWMNENVKNTKSETSDKTDNQEGYIFSIDDLGLLKDVLSSESIDILEMCLKSIYAFYQPSGKNTFYKMKRKILEDLKLKYKDY